MYIYPTLTTPPLPSQEWFPWSESELEAISKILCDTKLPFDICEKRAFNSVKMIFEIASRYIREPGSIEDALCYMRFPSSHHNFIRTTNGLERLFREVKRRTRVVGVFPGEKSAVSLSTMVMLRATEDWALRRYMDMEPLQALNSNPQL